LIGFRNNKVVESCHLENFSMRWESLSFHRESSRARLEEMKTLQEGKIELQNVLNEHLGNLNVHLENLRRHLGIASVHLEDLNVHLGSCKVHLDDFRTNKGKVNL